MITKTELKKQVKLQKKELEILTKEWYVILKKYGYGDSEIDRVWQGCIYAATLNIQVVIPDTLTGWEMWEQENSNEALDAMITNLASILNIIYQYRYFGLGGSEVLMDVVKPVIWRFVD